MSSSISRQLILWLAIPLMLLALCGALVHYFNNLAPGVITSDRRLKDASNALMTHLNVQQGRVGIESGTDVAGGPLASDKIRYVIRNSQGRALVGDPLLPLVAINDQNAQLFALAEIDGRNRHTLTTRFDTRVGLLLITVADIGPTSEPAARFGLMSTVLWDFVQLDVTLVLVWVGIQLGLRPVNRLRQQIAERSPHDLRPVDAAAVPREIAPVAVTLNRLFKALRYSVQSQQQFIANTAHQLRTPITGLQAQLAILVGEPAAEPIKSRLLTLEEGMKQLAHSANQLLMLARADPALNVVTKKQPVRLDTTAGDVAARHFDRALQLKIDLGVDLTSVSVLGDPSLLDDMLSNLVDNALKYTPAGGSVTLSTGARDGRPCLAVEDTGSGIPEAERQLVRQRFYRMPNSPGHGSGLGLSIVEEIARIHDATLAIAAGAGGRGTRISILFPATV